MKNLKWIKDSLFAHRGLHNKIYPENTMGAFLNAVENGYDIECDIQLTKDNRIVVFHDKTLKRLCGIDGITEDFTYEELQKLVVKNTSEKIPLLRDVLENIDENTQFLIEFKPSKRHKLAVEKFLLLMKQYNHRYAIHSFDPRIVYDFKMLAPNVIRGFISEKFSFKEYGLTGKMAAYLMFNRRIKPDFINYGIQDLPWRKLDKLKKKGTMILSYTAKTQEQLDFVRERYDNAVFEDFLAQK